MIMSAHTGPTVVETVDRRVFTGVESGKYRATPLVHKVWYKSIELLKKGKENGLILSTLYDIDVKKDGIETFVLTEEYKQQFNSLNNEKNKLSRVKPLPTTDPSSNQNKFFDSFSCRIMYEKELKRCEIAMKPVYIALFKMKNRALSSAFNILLKYMLYRRDIMRRAGEDRLANRRAQTHFFFVVMSKTFTTWYDYIILQKERLLRLKFVLDTRCTNYYKITLARWKEYLIKARLHDIIISNINIAY